MNHLIDDALLFTGPDGALLRKAADLAMHRDGTLQFTRHQPRDMQFVVVSQDVIVVAVRIHPAGCFQTTAIESDFRDTRAWARRDARWQVVAGHVSHVSRLP